MSLERERERERERLREREREREERRERERERERGEREIERERERERRREREREGREEREDLPLFRAKLLFHFFCARKRTTFPPMGRVTVHRGESGHTSRVHKNVLMHSCSHAYAIAMATIKAPSLRQTLHWGSHVRFIPPFFYGWLRAVRFLRPLT